MNEECWVLVGLVKEKATGGVIECVDKKVFNPNVNNNIKFIDVVDEKSSVVILKHRAALKVDTLSNQYMYIFNCLKNTTFDKTTEEKIRVCLLNMITSIRVENLDWNYPNEWYETEAQSFFLWLNRFGDSILSAFFFSLFYIVPYFKGDSKEKWSFISKKLNNEEFICPDFACPDIYKTKRFKRYLVKFNGLLSVIYNFVEKEIKMIVLACTYFPFFSVSINAAIKIKPGMAQLCKLIVQKRTSRSFIFLRDNNYRKILDSVFKESLFDNTSFTNIEDQITMTTLTDKLQSRNLYPVLTFNSNSRNFISNLNQFSGFIQSCAMPINPQFIFETILEQNNEQIINIPGLNKLKEKYLVEGNTNDYFEYALQSNVVSKIGIDILKSNLYINILDYIINNSDIFSCRGSCFLIAERELVNFYKNGISMSNKIINSLEDPLVNGLTYFIKERFDDIWANYNNKIIPDDYPYDCSSFFDKAVECLVNDGIRIFPKNAENRVMFKLMIKDSLIRAIKFKVRQIINHCYKKSENYINLKKSVSRRPVEYNILFLTIYYFPYDNYEKMKEFNPFFLSTKGILSQPSFFFISVMNYWFDSIYIETIVEILLNLTFDSSFEEKIKDLTIIINSMEVQNKKTKYECPFYLFLKNSKDLNKEIQLVNKKRIAEKTRIEIEKRKVEESEKAIIEETARKAQDDLKTDKDEPKRKEAGKKKKSKTIGKKRSGVPKGPNKK